MKIKTIAISILVIVATYIVAINLYDMYTIYEVLTRPVPMAVVSIGDQPITGMSATGFGISASIENGDSWSTVAKLIATIIGTYLGIKLINKYITK